MATLALLLLLCAEVGGVLSTSCSTDEDCNLNGVCQEGGCHCSDAWTGATCGELNMQPARPSPSSGYDEPGVTSWGGSVIVDPANDTVFHMFVSRMAGNCGMNSWTSNSEVVHAVALDPEGPYKFREVVVPAFAHGPSVRQLKDGSFAMLHLGCGTPTAPAKNCSSAKVEDAAILRKSATCDQFHVSLRTAPSLDGPWSDASEVKLRSGRNPIGWWWDGLGIHSFSNPAPYIKDDGSVLLAFRAFSKNIFSGLGEYVSVAEASSINGPFYDHRLAPASGHPSEDPFLWRDERGHWHMLVHNMDKAGEVGGHLYSRDAKDWVYSKTPPYTLNVEFSDGSAKRLYRRERPQLIADSTGKPLYFATGAWESAEDDHAYTLIVKLGAAKAQATIV